MRSLNYSLTAAVAMLVVLVGVGVAGASVVTLTVSLSNTQLSLDNSNGPTYTTYTVYASVTDNTTNDGYGDPTYSILHGGVSLFAIDQMYTPSGVIGHYPVQPPPPPNATSAIANTSVQSPFNALVENGTIRTGTYPTWTASRTGTSGVKQTFGAEALSGNKFVYYQTGLDYYQMGNLEVSGGTPVALYTGRIDAKANGAVDLTFAADRLNTLVWTVNNTGLQTALTDTVVPATAHINVSSAPNQAPVIDTLGPAIGENDWSKEPGWNNPAHTTINITATGHDPDSGPSPLSFIWTLTNPNPGGASHQLTATAAQINLTLSEIITKFGLAALPTGYGLPDYNYNWDLAVQAYDGAATSTGALHTTVFVPEPGTMFLLILGSMAAVRRGRR